MTDKNDGDWVDVEEYLGYTVVVHRDGKWSWRNKNGTVNKAREWGPHDVKRQIDRLAERKGRKKTSPLKGRRVVLTNSMNEVEIVGWKLAGKETGFLVIDEKVRKGRACSVSGWGRLLRVDDPELEELRELFDAREQARHAAGKAQAALDMALDKANAFKIPSSHAIDRVPDRDEWEAKLLAWLDDEPVGEGDDS